MTASTIGRPTLPQATVRSPAARSMASSICTVVVLPLVPVTASQGAGCSGSRSRHASSTSPQMGTPRSVACTSRGDVGVQPGEVTTRSTSAGSTAVDPAPTRTVAPRVSSRVACSRRSPVSDSSSAVTWAPRKVRLSAAAYPETPKPATTTRTPLQSLVRPRSGGTVMPTFPWDRWSNSGDPLGVEDPQPRGHEDPGDQPEADHDRDLLPAHHLEMVVQ